MSLHSKIVCRLYFLTLHEFPNGQGVAGDCYPWLNNFEDKSIDILLSFSITKAKLKNPFVHKMGWKCVGTLNMLLGGS